MIRSCAAAFGFLSRIWMPRFDLVAKDFAVALAWFPMVGAVLGLIGAGVLACASSYLGAAVASALTLTCLAWLTGGLHLDGLADTVDGLSAGRGDRERTLAVMSDSRIGAHGAVALILLLLLKWALLVRIVELQRGVGYLVLAVVSAMAFSRFGVAMLMVLFPAAKANGLGTLFRVPGAGKYAMLGGLWCVAVDILAWYWVPSWGLTRGCLGTLLGAVVAVGAGALVTRRLGGLTGDTLGAVLEVCEVVVLIGWGVT
jgi:adenosylcobinamide-GDP ribazoletransferase